jgi:hypothetical protein
MVLISDWGLVDHRDTVQLEELSTLIIPVTPSGIEPATSRLVALCLDQLLCRIPPLLILPKQISCGMVDVYRRFGETCTLHHLPGRTRTKIAVHHFQKIRHKPVLGFEYEKCSTACRPTKLHRIAHYGL